MAKTKIIATIGPACDEKRTIEKLIKAGVDVFRLNFKHSSLRWHATRMKRIREASSKLGIPVAIMVDLKGPELRLGKLKRGRLELKKGEVIFLSCQEEKGKTIIFEDPAVLSELSKGEKVLLDDGRLTLVVTQKKDSYLRARVVEGGYLYSHKGVNLPESEISLPSLSEKDIQAILLAKKYQADFVALSFVRQKEDIQALRRALEKEGLGAMVIAKIERKMAIENFEEILGASDGIMVARGDLGVELPMEEVPFWQKYIIRRCLRIGKPVITATEMLSSMIDNLRPTRAEVSDIANSVYDRTDALLLSTETAVGRYPVRAVAVMQKTCEFIEEKLEPRGVDSQAHTQTEAIVLAAYRLVRESDLPQPFTALVVLTETGKTARLLSRMRPRLPILALTPKKEVQRQLCLSFGVRPFYFDYRQDEVGRAIKASAEFLQKKGELKKGEKVVMIYGDDWRFPGRTNLVRIQAV